MIRTAWALRISSSLFGYGLNNVMPSDASVQEISWPNVVEVFEQEQRVTTGAAEAANIGCHMLNHGRWTGSVLNCQRMNSVWN